MTKTLLSIAGILLVCLGVWRLWEYYQKIEREKKGVDGVAAVASVAPEPLPALPPPLEQELAAARAKGAAGLRAWLDKYRNSPALKDPRLGAIELDYVVELTSTDLAQAKKVFAQIKSRTPTESPVYLRLKALEKAYE
jgi:hypothetical protein